MQPSTIASRLATLVLGVSLLALVVLAIGPRTGAYRTVTVLSDSMEPSFAAGDMIVVVPTPTSSLRAGDVITYEAPTAGRPVVTHRIEEIVERGTRPVVRTKGDANRAIDPWDARLTDTTAWRQVAVVPFAGAAIRFLRRDGVLQLAGSGVPLLLLALFLVDTWRPRPDAQDDELGGHGDEQPWDARGEGRYAAA